MTSLRRNADLTFREWQSHGGEERGKPRPLWLDEALSGEDFDPPRLAGRHEVDVCIVGGGFTGLWTANRLLEQEPTLRIAVLEASLCGSGASGRNSGAVSHWWGRLPSLYAAAGRENALKIVRAGADAVADMGVFVEENGIDCGYRQIPSLWSATTPQQVGAWNPMFAVAEKLGVTPPYRELSSAELTEQVGGEPYKAALMQLDAHHIQPAKLARGLRRVAIERGASVYEKSPVTRITSGAAGVSVRTAGGEVVAQHVVLGANAWMAHLDEFRRDTMVLSSDVIATAPIPERLAQLGMTDRPGCIDSRMMVNYYKFTPDGRIVFGRGGGTVSYSNRVSGAFEYSEPQIREVEKDFRFHLPALADVSFSHRWAGPVDRTPSGFPKFGKLSSDDRIHYAIGYSGHGVGASVLGGRILASSVLGRRDQWTDVGDALEVMQAGHYPPEPIRYLGARVVRKSLARTENAYLAGRNPNPVDKSLSKLASGTVEDVTRALTKPFRRS